jgi:hypothetical protein
MKVLFQIKCTIASLEIGLCHGERCATGTIIHRPRITGKSNIINSLASMTRKEYDNVK